MKNLTADILRAPICSIEAEQLNATKAAELRQFAPTCQGSRCPMPKERGLWVKWGSSAQMLR